MSSAAAAYNETFLGRRGGSRVLRDTRARTCPTLLLVWTADAPSPSRARRGRRRAAPDRSSDRYDVRDDDDDARAAPRRLLARALPRAQASTRTCGAGAWTRASSGTRRASRSLALFALLLAACWMAVTSEWRRAPLLTQHVISTGRALPARTRDMTVTS